MKYCGYEVLKCMFLCVCERERESVCDQLLMKDYGYKVLRCMFGGQDRKVIIKGLKGHIVKVCKDEAGHMVLLAIFDSVDDTVLVQKAILDVSCCFRFSTSAYVRVVFCRGFPLCLNIHASALSCLLMFMPVHCPVCRCSCQCVVLFADVHASALSCLLMFMSTHCPCLLMFMPVHCPVC